MTFVYGRILTADDGDELALRVDVEVRANRHPICSGFGQPGLGFDSLKQGCLSSHPSGTLAYLSSTPCGGSIARGVM